MAVFQALFAVLGAIYGFCILIAFVLWYTSRDRSYLWMLAYWGGSIYYFVSKLVMISAGTDIRWELVHNSVVVMVSFPALFAILYRMAGKRNDWEKMAALGGLSLIFSTAACLLDLSFSTVSWIAVAFMSPLPLYWNIKLWVSKRKHKTSALMHVLHLCFTLVCLQTLTYPFTRLVDSVALYQFALFMALTLAFAILLPALMMERVIKDQAEQLEELVEMRTRQLLQSRVSSAIGEVAAGVAHEVNNPLAIIHGYIRSLASTTSEYQKDPGRLQFLCSRIDLALERTLSITRGLQLFATSEAVNHNQHFDMKPLLLRIKNFCEERFRAQNVKVQIEYNSSGPQEWIFLGSESIFFQIIINLLSGWLEMLPLIQTNTMTIEPSYTGQGFRIDLRTQDPKLPQEIFDRLQNPFEITSGISKGSHLPIQLAACLMYNHGYSFERVIHGSTESLRIQSPQMKKG